MSAKRVLFLVLIASAVMLATGIAPRFPDTAQARPPISEPAPQEVTIPYSGRLDDDAGHLVSDGAYDFSFTLYAAQTGEEALWSEVQAGVAVEGGTFVALLGSANAIPPAALEGGERWLALAVRGSGDPDFTELTPRQRLNAAWSAAPTASVGPAAGSACQHDHLAEYWSGSAGHGLDISVYDEYALSGWSEFSIGVAGFSSVSSYPYPASPAKYGVYGYSDTDIGVYGRGAGRGVYGTSPATSGRGVEGYATASNSTNYGVVGVSNSPDGYGVYGLNNGGGYAGYFSGKVRVTGSLEKPGGGFKVDHPLDPEKKYLNHSFVESPDMKNIYDGVAELDVNGQTWVELPEWFGVLNKDFRYQLTPIGDPGPNLYISQEIRNNRFQIAGGEPGLKVSWQVTGVRRDPWAEAYRIPVEEEKPAEEQGTYLHPVAYGQPETAGLDYQRHKPRQGSESGGE